MRDLDEMLRAELSRQDADPPISAAAVLRNVYARRRTARVAGTAAAAIAVVGIGIGAQGVVGSLGGGPGLTTGATHSTPVTASTPPASAATGAPPDVPGHPTPRSEWLAGIPAYLTVAPGAEPARGVRVPGGGDRIVYSATAGSPVSGLVVIRNPAHMPAVPGSPVDLRPESVRDGTKTLVSDDTNAQATYLEAWSPSGRTWYAVVYGGDGNARQSVLESIAAATFI
ncbi:hypothetical protein [Polymorphospora rubra]|uniref:Uncharacterized protein n=1 Tax=Polymorphospora rubra TaxID=338584 RepID=A0A810NAD6_9ACTN|nr:hypothetical protein [Polymorphospora rubra]BCJ70187.1 hypothetical protein Prubr_72080 [Polymorphospora rubra]